MKKTLVLISLCLLRFPVASLAASNVADSEANPNTVVAEVNGNKVTLGELEQKRADNLFQAEKTYYDAERKVLDEYLNEYVLEAQAKQEGVTVEELLNRHVRSTLPKDPPDEALRVYYEGLDSKQSYEELRGQILEHIRDLRFQKAKAAYIASLRSRANIVISLPVPRANIEVANAPTLGERNAPVTVVEFADYECPYCQQAAPSVQKLESEYKGRVTFVYKDTPLPMHPHAEKAAEAALCAGDQGKYWDYHDVLFTTKQLEISELKQDARKLNLDTKAFDTCLDSGAKAPSIQTTLHQVEALQIPGTPAFFVNGRYLSGFSYEQLHAAIEEELAIAAPRTSQRAMR